MGVICIFLSFHSTMANFDFMFLQKLDEKGEIPFI